MDAVVDAGVPVRILVTGATGFVGNALCAHLYKLGHGVTVIVRRPAAEAGPYDVISIPRIEPQTDWSSALRGVDVVVHLAARVHLMNDASSDPVLEYRKENVETTLNLARQAAMQAVGRFVYLSSVKTNGELTLPGVLFRETDTPNPTDPYGRSKCEAEDGLRQLCKEGRMDLVIIRPPLVYGPGVKANFAALMRAVQRGWPLPLGSVRNRRSLVALGNLVDFIATTIEHPNAANQTFLVSDGHDISTPDLVRGLARAAGLSARLVPVPVWALKAGAALVGKSEALQRLCGNLQVDISKARALLGWEPPLTVEQGLLQAMESIRTP